MPPKPLAKPLKPIHVAGLILLLPICLAAFVVGIVGMRILLDEDGSSKLSQSAFGQLYKRLIAINPFFSALIFNGGMIGSMFCVTKLIEHAKAGKRAKQGPQDASLTSTAGVAAQANKKNK
ncbi:hypothetical protein PLESTB_000254900 [Pleodorina starrii]|uniref:Uncharacterized protein n=1 Tax=Pleodorina starrii TaxID=330485 RepID=A0A9W6BD32_9CHLO|nr:hypothetical protein PLESTM_000469900 [Pleodorina starrii]GLC49555.1 hypothetical protein PLESTB_000254900 [Pleodorina starrii]GLC76788.1 hypothetical protein PLESTF_001835300 [Pleodorina starrii]